MQTTSHFIQTNGIQLHYERTGGDKPPLVFCHGVTDNGRCFLRLAEHLSPRFDVILIDARGHGFSDAPEAGNYTADYHADDVHGLIQGLGLDKPILYGHSMGARTVCRFAAKYPEVPRAVILEDPVFIIPLTAEEIAGHNQWVRQMPAEIQRWKTLTEAELLQLAAEAGHRDWTEAEQLEWARSKSQVSSNVMGTGKTMGTIPQDFPKIVCPVLILKADADAETRQKNEAAAATIPHGKIIHVKDAGHNVRRENWADLTRYLDEFLTQLTKA
jgi:pimeloyl-ACP methyl ester carboxylesterase